MKICIMSSGVDFKGTVKDMCKMSAKYIPVENVLTPFLCFRGKIGGCCIFQLLDRFPRDALCKPVTAAIGPRATLQW